jgi:hypothetical protein
LHKYHSSAKISFPFANFPNRERAKASAAAGGEGDKERKPEDRESGLAKKTDWPAVFSLLPWMTFTCASADQQTSWAAFLGGIPSSSLTEDYLDFLCS